jgi:hypothetical protein
MRKQYFFMPAARGFHAWDVDRLAELTRNIPEISVKLSDISELDENFWYQGENDIPTVRSMVEHFRLVRDTSLEYPIILSAKGRVMDGMHRVAKALMLGHDRIPARQFATDPPPDHTDVYPNELSYD